MKSVNVQERERKFLLESVEKSRNWEREFIIYQWYDKVGEQEHSKLKLLFDLQQVRTILVRVTKTKVDFNTWDKRVDYIEEKAIQWEKLLGVDFVLKRRAISGNIFLDRFYRAKPLCEYLLEIEDEIIPDLTEIRLGKEVTENALYQNMNLCVHFEQQDLDYMKFLLCMIPGWEC